MKVIQNDFFSSDVNWEDLGRFVLTSYLCQTCACAVFSCLFFCCLPFFLKEEKPHFIKLWECS